MQGVNPFEPRERAHKAPHRMSNEVPQTSPRAQSPAELGDFNRKMLSTSFAHIASIARTYSHIRSS
jgi:hypothetical protein